MKSIIYTSLIGLIFYACTSGDPGTPDMMVSETRTGYLVNPLGIDSGTPKFSWKLQSEARGKYQTAFQVMVASSPEKLRVDRGDMWDSGKIMSGESVHAGYLGIPFESRHRYFWKVRVWDEHDISSPYSEMAWFETGVLDQDEWKAEWISFLPDSPVYPELLPAPYFRKEFTVDKEIREARLYISGLGYYKTFINGEKTGDHELDPVFTRYDRRVKYVVYDVGDMLRSGRNCIAAVLGNGWYNQHTRSAWDLDSASWRDDPALFAELTVSFTDGTQALIRTDGSWKAGHGPIVFDGIRNGEHYDARLEIPGWNKPGFNDGGWKNASVVKGPEGKLSAQLMPPVRVIRELEAAGITEPAPGIYVLDFGENIVGRVRLNTGGEAGREIIFRYGEKLKLDGTLDQKELARFIWTGETQTDRYICKGGQGEKWEPSFVYHGFQYIQVEGLEEFPGKDEISATELHTDLEKRGHFSCSNEMLNKLQQIILNSFLGNYFGYPTDCPHREKIGWSGDAQLVSMTALYNFEMIPAYLKWIDDFADEQRDDGKVPAIIPTGGWGYTFGRGKNREYGYGPHWDGAYINIPWDMYRFSGDPGIFEKYYGGFKAYLDYLVHSADDFILDYGIDDHKPVTTITEGDIISTAYFYDLSRKMADIAEITGHKEDAVKFRHLSENIFSAFNKRFFNEKTGRYGNGGQTSMAMAIHLGLVPDAEEARVEEQLLDVIREHDYHIDAGVIGTRFMIKALTELGYPEILYRIVNQPDYPGWGFWIKNGATSMWQTWKGDMSLNHIMFGSIGEWFYYALGGIRPDTGNPGFREFELKPELTDSLEWVDCRVDSQYGEIKSCWKMQDGEFEWEVSIPVNTSAHVSMPFKEGKQVLESGQKLENNPYIRKTGQTSDRLMLDVASGNYRFIVK